MEIINEYGLEQLCNAVIILAAKDYRTSMKYLKKHPRTPQLMAKVASDRAEREKKRREWIKKEKDFLISRMKRRAEMRGEDFDENEQRKSLKVVPPKRMFPLTRDEQLLNRIIKHEGEVSEIEEFFRSEYYTLMTEVDGEYLLRKLKEEFADESD